MCDRSERRLLAEEREEERYRELYAEVEDKMRAEYMRDFGPTYRQKYAFKPDGAVIHKIVERIMSSRWDE